MDLKKLLDTFRYTRRRNAAEGKDAFRLCTGKGDHGWSLSEHVLVPDGVCSNPEISVMDQISIGWSDLDAS